MSQDLSDSLQDTSTKNSQRAKLPMSHTWFSRNCCISTRPRTFGMFLYGCGFSCCQSCSFPVAKRGPTHIGTRGRLHLSDIVSCVFLSCRTPLDTSRQDEHDCIEIRSLVHLHCRKSLKYCLQRDNQCLTEYSSDMWSRNRVSCHPDCIIDVQSTTHNSHSHFRSKREAYAKALSSFYFLPGCSRMTWFVLVQTTAHRHIQSRRQHTFRAQMVCLLGMFSLPWLSRLDKTCCHCMEDTSGCAAETMQFLPLLCASGVRWHTCCCQDSRWKCPHCSRSYTADTQGRSRVGIDSSVYLHRTRRSHITDTRNSRLVPSKSFHFATWLPRHFLQGCCLHAPCPCCKGWWNKKTQSESRSWCVRQSITASQSQSQHPSESYWFQPATWSGRVERRWSAPEYPGFAAHAKEEGEWSLALGIFPRVPSAPPTFPAPVDVELSVGYDFVLFCTITGYKWFGSSRRCSAGSKKIFLNKQSDTCQKGFELQQTLSSYEKIWKSQNRTFRVYISQFDAYL